MNPARQAAVQIVRALAERGHVAYFAGGCVRDELLGVEPDDYDVATDATPDDVRAVFRSVSEVGASFGVMLVREQKQTIEVATFRTEGVYTDKRRPDSVAYADAPSDARRRDFTINAMFLDPLADAQEHAGRRVGGRVIDFVGGIGDLETGVVRAVGDPNERLAEDHLRALRAVRFAARFGFAIEEATGAAVRAHAAELTGVSEERVGDEIRRMLAHPARTTAIDHLESLGLDAPALGDGLPPGGTAWVHGSASLGGALAGWAAGRLEASGAGGPGWDVTAIDRLVGAWRGALCLSNDERDALRGALAGAGVLASGFLGAGAAQQKRWASAAWFADAFGMLSTRGVGAPDEVGKRIEELAATPGGLSPQAFVDGRDLIALGFPPGPEMGRALDRLYDMQLENAVADRPGALEAAGRLLRDSAD